jgi:hypothetical protein
MFWTYYYESPDAGLAKDAADPENHFVTKMHEQQDTCSGLLEEREWPKEARVQVKNDGGCNPVSRGFLCKRSDRRLR